MADIEKDFSQKITEMADKQLHCYLEEFRKVLAEAGITDMEKVKELERSQAETMWINAVHSKNCPKREL